MPQATPADLHVLALWVTAGSVKEAAARAGVRRDTFSHRLMRVCRRHGVSSPRVLAIVLADELRPYVTDAE